MSSGQGCEQPTRLNSSVVRGARQQRFRRRCYASAAARVSTARPDEFGMEMKYFQALQLKTLKNGTQLWCGARRTAAVLMYSNTSRCGTRFDSLRPNSDGNWIVLIGAVKTSELLKQDTQFGPRVWCTVHGGGALPHTRIGISCRTEFDCRAAENSNNELLIQPGAKNDTDLECIGSLGLDRTPTSGVLQSGVRLPAPELVVLNKKVFVAAVKNRIPNSGVVHGARRWYFIVHKNSYQPQNGVRLPAPQFMSSKESFLVKGVYMLVAGIPDNLTTSNDPQLGSK
ncbi:hypothetical protein K438DRAFT_1758200 [Mycena galopus ATCC 62051]|nr:hypothetical protein K438DRAFT_1758200 [Mycena galopus ATCC 62051]